MSRAGFSAAITGMIVSGLLALMPVCAVAQGFGGPESAAAGAAAGSLGDDPGGARGLAQGSGDPARPAPGSMPGASLVESLNRALERAIAAPDRVTPAVNALIAPAVPPEPSPVVVELFTSQGCSACPPADALLARMAARPDVLALSLHVDYWDYLGWQDPFAQPAFTARQKGYARAAGLRTLFTPQVIVGGEGSLTAPDAAALEAMIDAARAQKPRVSVTIAPGAEGGHFVLDLAAPRPLDHRMVVQIVRYVPQAQVEILRGENAGRVLDFANVVTAWHAVAEWDGQSPLRLTASIDGEEPAVVIVQTALPGKTMPLPGPILAAAWLR